MELARTLAGVFKTQGLTTLALAYVLEEGLPKQFLRVPVDTLEAAAKRLHDMGYEKVGLWGISFVPGSCWSFHGKEIPYTAYQTQKFPLGEILRKSIRIKDVTMYDRYLPLVQNPISHTTTGI